MLKNLEQLLDFLAAIADTSIYTDPGPNINEISLDAGGRAADTYLLDHVCRHHSTTVNRLGKHIFLRINIIMIID